MHGQAETTPYCDIRPRVEEMLNVVLIVQPDHFASIRACVREESVARPTTEPASGRKQLREVSMAGVVSTSVPLR
jgi:hypothetical protein